MPSKSASYKKRSRQSLRGHKMGYIYARLIFKGLRTFESVPKKWKDATKAAYKDIYGIEL